MQPSYRIIIVEDQEVVARLLARLILRRYPTATIQTCENGKQALLAYDQAQTDLLLVNHGLPGMDGPTVTRTLRGRGDSVPIIGFSGTPSLAEQYIVAGATAFVCTHDLLRQLVPLIECLLAAPYC